MNITKEDLIGQEIFTYADLNQVIKIIKNCPIKIFKKNEALVKSGDIDNSIHLIISGEFGVFLTEKQDDDPVTVLKKGQSIGEIAMIDHQVASAYVIALTESRIITIDEGVAWELVASSNEVANNILIILSQRLRHGNSVINKMKGLLNEYHGYAFEDSLSKLHNRRWMEHYLPEIIESSDSDNKPISILMIDIDYFKKFNDTYGHRAGDYAIRYVSAAIKENIKDGCHAIRYGGEEITVILPSFDKKQAQLVAEDLRIIISNLKIEINNELIIEPVTISIGVYQYEKDDDDDSLIEKADKALYKAKKLGRNRIYPSLALV